jgi:hydrogenase maturation factor
LLHIGAGLKLLVLLIFIWKHLTTATINEPKHTEMYNRLILPIGALVASLLIASVLATVTYDPYSGLGFVGKGDVQIAFSWSNAQPQSYADSNLISFLFQLKEPTQSSVVRIAPIICRRCRKRFQT